MNKIIFLSTPSARRATVVQWAIYLQVNISIHALREEGDRLRRRMESKEMDFYPRPPRGGRPPDPRLRQLAEEFLSTPSARRATRAQADKVQQRIISIHALREEGDINFDTARSRCEAFLSTPSARRATALPLRGSGRDRFLSTPSARRATYTVEAEVLEHDGFLSTPSARRATVRPCLHAREDRNFYPRPPRGGRPNTGRIA